jgi:hypothetical protein
MSFQHLIPHGGIGQMALSFVKLMKANNVKVDIITDKFDKPTEFTKTLINEGARFIYPDTSLSYTTHQGIFMYGDSYCLERMINFRNAIIKAFNTNIYNSIVCNTYETSRLLSEMGLEDCVQIINYTHLESQIFTDSKNPFLDNVNESMRLELMMPKIVIGTQSIFNCQVLEAKYNQKVFELPIPLPEPDLLKEHHKTREGVLFIGRWEEGKNPEAYIKVMKSCNLPCKVMTSETSVKKFVSAFDTAGITDYTIKADIAGKEKVDFITSSKVYFMPSLRENYPFAFIECLGHMPTVVLDIQDWSTNFDQSYFFKEKLDDVAPLITQLYNSTGNYYDTKALEYIQTHESNFKNAWVSFLDKYLSTGKKSSSNTAQLHTIIDNKTTIRYDEFFKNDLGRSSVDRNDYVSIFGNRNKYKLVYTDHHTYLSKDIAFSPSDVVQSSISLFEGL